MDTSRKLSRTIIGGLAIAAAAGVLTPLSASAVSADCVVGISSRGVYRFPTIACAEVVDAEARARADCTAAPDTYTAWVQSWETSVGGSCLFGARGAILAVRAA